MVGDYSHLVHYFTHHLVPLNKAFDNGPGNQISSDNMKHASINVHSIGETALAGLNRAKSACTLRNGHVLDRAGVTVEMCLDENDQEHIALGCE